MDSCEIRCLEPDAFGFAGAANVTTVYLQFNPVASFPEGLLWNTPSLLFVYARGNKKMETLPEKFVSGQSKLIAAFFTSCSFTHLPGNILKGLSNLVYLALGQSSVGRMPNMDDQTVRVTVRAPCPAAQPPRCNLRRQCSPRWRPRLDWLRAPTHLR